MNEESLALILCDEYGIGNVSLEPLREGGGHTYLASGERRYLLKVIGSAFADTARQSISVMRYLEENGFSVPKTILTKTGEAFSQTGDGGDQLIVVQEFLEGEEPDLEKTAPQVGALVGSLHDLLDRCPVRPVLRDRAFFIGRYLEFLRKKAYPRLSAYEELGGQLWEKVKDLPAGICHGDLHRGNLLETADGKIYLLDFDTVCRAPRMFDVMVLCDMTDYFRLKRKDIGITRSVFRNFAAAYSRYRTLSRDEIRSFPVWTAIRHFQLQATILEIYGIDCINEAFIDAQLAWLHKWLEAAEDFFES